MLQIRNYLFYCNGKRFCSFTFFPLPGTECLPIFTYLLDFKMLEILLLRAEGNNWVRKRIPISPVLWIRLFSLFWSLFVYLFHHNSSFDLTIRMFYLLGYGAGLLFQGSLTVAGRKLCSLHNIQSFQLQKVICRKSLCEEVQRRCGNDYLNQCHWFIEGTQE